MTKIMKAEVNCVSRTTQNTSYKQQAVRLVKDKRQDTASLPTGSRLPRIVSLAQPAVCVASFVCSFVLGPWPRLPCKTPCRTPARHGLWAMGLWAAAGCALNWESSLPLSTPFKAIVPAVSERLYLWTRLPSDTTRDRTFLSLWHPLSYVY